VSYIGTQIAAFLRLGDKVVVDAGVADSRLPVESAEERELLEEIRDQLLIMNMYLAEIHGEEIKLD